MMEPSFLPTKTFFLDREGRWFCEGEPVLHQRLLATLHRGLSRREDDSCCVRWGGYEADVEVELTLFVVTRVKIEGSALRLWLNNKQTSLLDTDTLFHEEGLFLYCCVEEEIARFGRSAHQQLLSWIEEGTEEDFLLDLAGKKWPLPQRSLQAEQERCKRVRQRRRARKQGHLAHGKKGPEAREED